ncbi:MAG: peptide chain release factor N(5)-glutamine methyltransferase [Bacteroidetes bacterium]|nr:peptide chain release factor N(5)-glutamine methyltransferase [Bacteroidota bacterium]
MGHDIYRTDQGRLNPFHRYPASVFLFTFTTMLNDLIKQLSQQLTSIYGSREANNIAQYLAEEHFGKPLVRSNPTLDMEQLHWWETASKRLLSNEPVQYVLGKAWFYGRKLKVDPSTLIPRPETEELVELILKENNSSNPTILDIGCGSGCIALTLKLEIPNSEVFALDKSTGALEVTRTNAALYNAHLTLLEADMLNPEPWEAQLPQFDIIVSNPPYIAPEDKKTMENNVLMFEPMSALFAEHADPLVFYREISRFATKKLKPGGKLYFEIPHNKAETIEEIVKSYGFEEIRILQDMQGNDRMLTAIFPQ